MKRGNILTEKERKRKSLKEKEIEKRDMAISSDVAERTTDQESRSDLPPMLPFTAM